MTTTEGEITEMSPATDYTMVVHGYTVDGKDIGTTLPLHVKTYASLPQLNIIGNPGTTSNTTLELAFSRPIDVKKTQITLTEIQTKKPLPVLEIKNASTDLRIIVVTLQNIMQLDA